MTTPTSDLKTQLEKIGLRALAQNLDPPGHDGFVQLKSRYAIYQQATRKQLRFKDGDGVAQLDQLIGASEAAGARAERKRRSATRRTGRGRSRRHAHADADPSPLARNSRMNCGR